jgi:hypothetical protein
LETFFDGSTEQVVTALVGGEVSRLTPEELERLSQLLAKAKANNRQKKEDPQ